MATRRGPTTARRMTAPVKLMGAKTGLRKPRKSQHVHTVTAEIPMRRTWTRSRRASSMPPIRPDSFQIMANMDRVFVIDMTMPTPTTVHWGGSVEHAAKPSRPSTWKGRLIQNAPRVSSKA